MGMTCSMHAKIWLESLKGRDYLEDQGKIILKCMLKEKGVRGMD
jgi:hypothetical protein